MSEPFIAEIRMFTYTFAPRGWAYCNGQIMDISQNTSLFALVGTTYGGDGYTTFGIPNLKGRAPMHPGRGPGLSYYRLGQSGGSAGVYLTEATIPNHSHTMVTTLNPPTSDQPAGLYPTKHKDTNLAKVYKENPTLNAQFAAESVSVTGTDQMHENRQPFLGVPFCIALIGIFPTRS